MTLTEPRPRIRPIAGTVLGVLAFTAAALTVSLLAGAGLRAPVHVMAPRAMAVSVHPAPAGSAAEIAALLRAVAVALGACALLGAVAVRLGQPRVIGEVLAGILLGPTLLGRLWPGVEGHLFGGSTLHSINDIAQLALALLAFQIGLEMDLAAVRARAGGVAAVAVASVGVPLGVGALCALITFPIAGPHAPYAAYALFLGATMSITALPVLARILTERGLSATPIGTLTLSAAGIGDLSGWLILAVAGAIAHARSPVSTLRTLGLIVALVLVLAGVVRPLLQRLGRAGRVGPGITALTLVIAIGAAAASASLGVSVIFGGLAAGACIPRRGPLRRSLQDHLSSYAILLLPLFFAATGLRTDVALLDRPQLILLAGLLTVAAGVSKGTATMLAARRTGLSWREGAMVGALMDTRGLTELAALSVALTSGALGSVTYAAMVSMALITTALTGPLLNRLTGRPSVTPAGAG